MLKIMLSNILFKNQIYITRDIIICSSDESGITFACLRLRCMSISPLDLRLPGERLQDQWSSGFFLHFQLILRFVINDLLKAIPYSTQCSRHFSRDYYERDPLKMAALENATKKG